MRLLIIEDEEPLAKTLTKGLNEEGYAVDWAAAGEEGLHFAQNYEFDAIVLDLMLPEIDGAEILRRLRAEGKQTPVLVLTARDSLDDKVECFRLGTDDYLTKPFAFAELLARLRALIRRSHGVTGNSLTIEDLHIDLDARSVRRAGEPVQLTATEYSLLEYLALNRGRVITRTELAEHLWSHDWEKMSNVLDVHIANLRRKIDRGHERRLVTTSRGSGYLIPA
ncbi:MAG: response regulator transcription factor [Candidatus Sumerlaeia bacterium]|nr:response regulator transcription factor [Candidatus Sumerlaeia bacterium]